MIDKDKRKEEINEAFENKFTRLLEQCKGQEGWQLFVDTIITQEQSMIEKLEADKVELLKALKESYDYCDSNCYAFNDKYESITKVIQTMENEYDIKRLGK